MPRAFELIAPKEIANVFTLLGTKPDVDADNIVTPNIETASNMYRSLAEFAYDLDIQNIKARAPEVPGFGPFMEIFDDSMDLVSIFALSKRLAHINRIEDFSIRDLWDPQAKRLRAILSGTINFCRYKESKGSIIVDMKDKVQILDNIRLELEHKSHVRGHELAEAQAQHSAELEDMWNAENEMQEANNMVEKLEKQQQTANCVFETADSKANAAQEKVSQSQQRAQQLRDSIAALEEQVAESPEGLEQEIQEIRQAICQQKERVEEKTAKKRSQTQRVHVLARLDTNVSQYKDMLQKVVQSHSLQMAACENARSMRSELSALRELLEARCAEEGELGKSTEQVSADMDAAKQTHEDQMLEFEERRQQAVGQQQELQEKRTEEQRQWSDLQGQKAALDTELASVRRGHDADINDYQFRIRTIQDEGAQLVAMMDSLMQQYDDEAGRGDTGGTIPSSRLPMASPGSSQARRVSATSPGSARRHSIGLSDSNGRHMIGAFSTPGRKSPGPRRLQMERAGC